MATLGIGIGVGHGGRTGVYASLAALLLAAVAVFALSSPGPAPTVHSGLFELGPTQGADILGSPAIPGPDWADIFDANGDVADLNGGTAAAFIKDDLSQSDGVDVTTYSGAGGSNKNGDAIAAWHWDAGNVPAKDDLSNAYAWATVQSGHLILFAGFERIDASGDSHVDIEFFQDEVTLDEQPPCDDPGADVTPCSFLGVRTPGDLVISMDFVQGGGFGTLSIRRWTGSAYVVIGSRNGEGCNGGDTICGFNNGGPIDGGPWPNYDRHGAEIQQLPQNAFTEFGLDVTALGDGTPCLTTALGKTRSSQSFTAELKDFAGPVAFPVCALAWHKVDNTGAALGGATFVVCRTHSYNPTTRTFTDIPDQCRRVVDNTDGSLDAGDVDLDPRPGEFEIGGVLLGRYTIRETVPPRGWGADPDVVTVDFTGGSLRVEVLEAFVDGRPIVKLVELGYTNTPTGTPTAGIVTGRTVFTVRLRNFGTATAIVSGTLAVSVSGEGSGTHACTPGCTVTFSASIVPGTETSVTLTIDYTDFADGAQVRADLAASYTTPPDTTAVREASGAPAVIIFTVQAD